MRQLRPRGSGPRNCLPEQGFFGVSTLEGPAREVHLEGVARWAPIDGRGQGGRRGRGVARGRGVTGRGRRPAWPDAGVGGRAGGGGGAGRGGPTPPRRAPPGG